MTHFALLEITGTVYESWGVYYAGWNRSSSAPQISCGVHHPGGDPKKINFDDDYATNSPGINWEGGEYTPPGSHWKIIWDEGGTEGGSSGSPAYDDEGRVIGQLTGGSGDCNSGDTEDYYGKFSRAFSDIDGWLDPLNTGETTIDGTYDGANNSDSDGDGVPDDEDSDENNQYQCSDNDSDTCDDCSSGTYNPSNDGWDYDADGMCDAGDMDDDNDNVPDNQDSDDNNEFICSNNDGDSCDDCSYGYYDPENDGCIYEPGDVSLDGAINIVDVVMLVNIIIGNYEPSDEQLVVADLNNDNLINVADIVLLVSAILG